MHAHEIMLTATSYAARRCPRRTSPPRAARGARGWRGCWPTPCSSVSPRTCTCWCTRRRAGWASGGSWSCFSWRARWIRRLTRWGGLLGLGRLVLDGCVGQDVCGSLSLISVFGNPNASADAGGVRGVAGGDGGGGGGGSGRGEPVRACVWMDGWMCVCSQSERTA